MTAVRFNIYGNPEKPARLTLEEFKECYGTNELRNQIIEEAVKFFKIFKSYGCRNIYITGSFITTKTYPNDIDICIDIAGLDCTKLSERHPDFFTTIGINKIKQKHKCHFAVIFDSSFISITNLGPLNTDRNNNPRPMINLVLNESL